MIFLSAQPDGIYFYWQLELLIFNFRKLSVDTNKLHILIGYDGRKKLSDDYQNFVKKYKTIKIFAYSDTRKVKSYASSLRPHILSKHFQKYPYLERENFFYHDSDIIFSKPIDFKALLKDDVWYVSDTRNYLDSKYIIKMVGEEVFFQLCHKIGMDPKHIQANDDNAGGSQYLLKKPTAQFWKAVEEDSEKIYSFLSNNEIEENRRVTGLDKKPYIQKWCADMWALFWNALKINKNVQIHRELEFCWINSPVSLWDNTRILHYTGFFPEQKGYIFNKEDYFLYPPFYESFDKIAKDSCSYPLIQLLNEFGAYNLQKRRKLKDVTFLILVSTSCLDRIANLYMSVNYINNNFDTKITVLELNEVPNVNPSNLPASVKYIFKKVNSSRLVRNKVNYETIAALPSKFVAIYDANIVIPKKQISSAINILRKGVYKCVSPYDGTYLNIDILMKELFSKIMDDKLLEDNQFKFEILSERSFGGCLFISKSDYLMAGMKDKSLFSLIPNAKENALDLNTVRIKGNLYNLHQKEINSKIKNSVIYEESMLKYLNISNPDRRKVHKSYQ